MSPGAAPPGRALVTGADRGLGHALAAGLAQRGWQVFAGRYLADWPGVDELAAAHPDRVVPVALDVGDLDSVRAAADAVARQTDGLELVVNNAGVNSPSRTQPIRTGLDYDELHRLYDINACGPLRVVEAFLPLTDAGRLRRLAFVSSEAGSIEAARRSAWHSYCMSKAALNMGVRLLFNELRPEGYSFRLYHPGWVRSWIGGTGQQGTAGGTEPADAARPALDFFTGPVDDEDRLVLRGPDGEAWPW